MPELKNRPEALVGIAEKDIITIVSGLPRSGTSLMMQLLEAAGFPRKRGAQFLLGNGTKGTGFVFRNGQFTRHTSVL